MDVISAMTKPVIKAAPDDTIKDTARKMRDKDIGCLPVCDGDKVVGMITDRDITCRAVADGVDVEKLTVREIMKENPVWCNEAEDLEDAIRLMENNQVRRLPVLDDNNKMVGILSVGDVSQYLSHELSGEVIERVSQPAQQSGAIHS